MLGGWERRGRISIFTFTKSVFIFTREEFIFTRAVFIMTFSGMLVRYKKSISLESNG